MHLRNIPWSLDLVQISMLIPWFNVAHGSTDPMKVTYPCLYKYDFQKTQIAM